MTDLRVRIYNVLFGDAILLSIPEIDEAGRAVTVQVLIDVGNALAGDAGDDSVFEAVLSDIRDELNGAALDLYVMTHEHMDHIQGPLFGSRKLGIELKAKRVWMTASSAEDYYDRFIDARKRKSLALTAYDEVTSFLAASGSPRSAALAALLAVNNPRASRDCVDFIRGMSGQDPVYVHRTADVQGLHPFRRTRLRLLAPEEDTSVYYGRLAPRTLGAMSDDATAALLATNATTPPAGVSAGDFFDLVRFRSKTMSANLRTIDKAANNSSLAIELEWDGWRLLFPGDAEEKSWEIMDRLGLLRPVHFLKVSHHGSGNGSPEAAIDKVMPAIGHDGRPRSAVVSTRAGAYPGVPDDATLERLSARATLHDTRSLEPGTFVDLTFAAMP